MGLVVMLLKSGYLILEDKKKSIIFAQNKKRNDFSSKNKYHEN